MTQLVDNATLRSLIETDLTDTALSLLAEDAEAEIVLQYGPHTGDVTENFEGGNAHLFPSRHPLAIVSVATVASDGSLTTLDPSTYVLEGGAVRRLAGVWWTCRMRMTYTPVDDQARRKRVLVDLVRLAVTYDATSSTRLGDTSTNHLSYEQERANILSRLGRAIASFE